MSQKGIIFEGAYEKSFMFHALNEGIISAVDRDVDRDEEQIIKSIIHDFRSAKKRSEALDFALIYDKVYLYSYNDSFNMSNLFSENIVENIDPIDPATYSRQRNDENLSPYLNERDIPTLSLLKPVILPYLRRSMKRLTSSSYDIMVNLLASEEFRLSAHRGEISNSISRELLSISRLKDHSEHIVQFLKTADSEKLKHLRKDLNLEIGGTFFETLHVYDKLITCIDLLKHSSTLSIPLASPLLSKPKNIKYNRFIPDNIKNNKIKDSYLVYQAILEEVECFPVVKSLGHVLKLRKDKRISDFRENLNWWADAINKGDYREESKLRNELKRSNAAMKSVGPWKKAGGLITYLALPLSIIPYVGLPLAVLGTAIQIYVDSIEWKNRWLMIGR